MVKQSASEELIPNVVHQTSRTVAGLQPGRAEGRESQLVRRVQVRLLEIATSMVAMHSQSWGEVRPPPFNLD